MIVVSPDDISPSRYLLSNQYPKHVFAVRRDSMLAIMRLSDHQRAEVVSQIFRGDITGAFCLRCGVSVEDYIKFSPLSPDGMECHRRSVSQKYAALCGPAPTVLYEAALDSRRVRKSREMMAARCTQRSPSRIPVFWMDSTGALLVGQEY